MNQQQKNYLQTKTDYHPAGYLGNNTGNKMLLHWISAQLAVICLLTLLVTTFKIYTVSSVFLLL